jgi:hypothetical protein
MSAKTLRFSIALSLAMLPLSGAQAANDKSVMLVLDASGSMKAALPDGTTRMDAAKTAVAQLVSTLPDNTSLAFRAYGHQSPQSAKNCKDSALLTPFDTVAKNKSAVIAKALSLQPQGYTPITYSLTLAGQDMLQQEAASHVVVLVSDGKETCEADPCAMAKSLAEADAKLVVHTIGAGVDEPTRKQLQCIASAARGSYFDANSSIELAAVVGKAAETEAVEAPAKPVVKTAISQKSSSTDQNAPTAIEAGEIVKGRLGDSDNGGTYHFWKVKLPAGKHRVVFDARHADSKNSLLQTEIQLVSAGGEMRELVGITENDFQRRAAVTIESTGEEAVLRVGNSSGIVDYWLGAFPADAEITAPFFVKTPPVQAVEFGKAYTASLAPKPGAPGVAWYALKLKAADYKITADFKRTDGKKDLINADVFVFGPIGEQLNQLANVCSVSEYDTGGACSAKLVMAQDADVLLRLQSNNDSAFKTTFKVEPIEE